MDKRIKDLDMNSDVDDNFGSCWVECDPFEFPFVDPFWWCCWLLVVVVVVWFPPLFLFLAILTRTNIE
jgi:hypothetical protein